MWRAVDCEGEVLDILVQSRRNKKAALRLMRKLLKKQGFVPDAFVTDKLPSYGAALKIWVFPNIMILVDERTTGRRILTCRFGNANDECSASSRPDQRNDFFPPMPPSTTPSTFSVI